MIVCLVLVFILYAIFSLLLARAKYKTYYEPIKELLYRCEKATYRKFERQTFNLKTWRQVACEELKAENKLIEYKIIKNCSDDELVAFLSRYAGIDLE